MKVLYLSTEIEEQVAGFDQGCLAEVVDKVITFVPPLGEEELAVLADGQNDDLFVVAARNPRMISANDHRYVPVELANMGINPGKVGYVDLNHIHLASAGRESFLDRLKLHVGLTFIKLKHTRENPMVSCAPNRSLLVVGSNSDLAFMENLEGSGIHVVGIWTMTAADIDPSAEVAALSGMPGNYAVEIRTAAGIDSVMVGGILIFCDGLTTEQRKIISAAFLLPLKQGRLHLLSNQLRLSQAVKLVGEETSLESVSHFFIDLLLKEEVVHFIEDPVIDHTKCGLCGTCVKTCMFQASFIDVSGDIGVSSVDPNRCVACGNCVTACPTQARDLPAYSYDYFSAVWQQMRTFSGDANGLKVLVLYCESNGHDAICQMIDGDRDVPASCLFFRIRCGARVDTQFIPDSFRAGFDGIAVIVCAREECGNIVGSLDLERRLNLYRKVMQATGIETGRMRIMPVASSQLESVGDSLTQFAGYLEDLKQDKKLLNTFLQ